MFLLKSAFWLAIGFALVAPHGTDFGATVAQVKDQAITAGLQAGQQLLVSQVIGNGPLAVAASHVIPTPPSADRPMQDSPAAPFVFPRPRPAAMG